MGVGDERPRLSHAPAARARATSRAVAHAVRARPDRSSAVRRRASSGAIATVPTTEVAAEPPRSRVGRPDDAVEHLADAAPAAMARPAPRRGCPFRGSRRWPACSYDEYTIPATPRKRTAGSPTRCARGMTLTPGGEDGYRPPHARGQRRARRLRVHGPRPQQRLAAGLPLLLAAAHAPAQGPLRPRPGQREEGRVAARLGRVGHRLARGDRPAGRRHRGRRDPRRQPRRDRDRRGEGGQGDPVREAARQRRPPGEGDARRPSARPASST